MSITINSWIIYYKSELTWCMFVASGLSVIFQNHASCWELNSQGNLLEQTVFSKHISLRSFSFKEIWTHKQSSCLGMSCWFCERYQRHPLRTASAAQGHGDVSESDFSCGTHCGKEPPCRRAELRPNRWLTWEHTQPIWQAVCILFKQNMFIQSSSYFHN